MFHRITLEAGKLSDARLVRPISNAARARDREDSESRTGLDHGDYEELYFYREHETFNRWKLPLAFVVYLGTGTLYYNISPGNGVDLDGVLGFYQVRRET